MNMTGPVASRWLGMVLAVGGMAVATFGQTAPQGAPPTNAATRPAPTAASDPASRPRRPTVAEVLSKKKVKFEFAAATANEVLAFMGQQFDAKIENAFAQELDDRLTINTELSATEAINILNSGLQPKGYSVSPSVRTDEGTPRLVLTLLQIKADAGDLTQVFVGMDPAAIPEGNEMRTQIMTVKNVDLEKYKDMITAVLSKQASININVDTKTLMITDTSTHIRSLASLLQVLDNAPAAGGK